MTEASETIESATLPHARDVRLDHRPRTASTFIVSLLIGLGCTSRPASETPAPRQPATEGSVVGGGDARSVTSSPSALAHAAADTATAQGTVATAAQTQAFVETIAGTVVSIEMLPVPSDAADTPPIWMSATEVTWDAYDAFVFELDRPSGELAAGVDAIARPSKPYILMDRGFGHAGYPAISVNHTGASAFCAWLSAKTGKRYRLGTEVEWERACRAGSTGAWSTGDDPAELDRCAWYRDNAQRKTHPVGTKSPNAFGFHDMHGNAAEWCLGADGKPVVRGGSYRDAPAALRASARVTPSAAWNASDPQLPKSKWWLADGGFIGFRIVCEGD